jgi:hypothetical protein
VRIFILALTSMMAFTNAVHAENFRLREVAGKSQSAVEKILGKADKCETIRASRIDPSPKCGFKGSQVEVVFIGGKADWITVKNPDVGFEEKSIEYLGLQPKDPDLANDFVMRWNGIGGFHQVSAFPGAGTKKVDYFYIKALTD